MIQHQSSSGGYIALTSTIIVSILIMGVAFTTSQTSFVSRFNILNTEFKEQSSALAEACVDVALLKLSQNEYYSGNENINIGDKQCLILPIEISTGQKTIKTKAIIQKAVTNLKIIIDDSDLSIVSWEEMSNF